MQAANVLSRFYKVPLKWSQLCDGNWQGNGTIAQCTWLLMSLLRLHEAYNMEPPWRSLSVIDQPGFSDLNQEWLSHCSSTQRHHALAPPSFARGVPAWMHSLTVCTDVSPPHHTCNIINTAISVLSPQPMIYRNTYPFLWHFMKEIENDPAGANAAVEAAGCCCVMRQRSLGGTGRGW